MSKERVGNVQARTLGLTFKFRFITAIQLAKVLKISNQAAREILSKLVTKDLVTRKYSSYYKIDRRSAEYYVSKSGIKYLKNSLDFSAELLQQLYFNPKASEDFIKQCLSIVDVYISLIKTYEVKFKIYTKQELVLAEDIIRPCPNLCLNRQKDSKTKPNEYYLDDLTITQSFIIKKRVRQYLEHYESDEWDGDTYPTVLLVLNTPAQEKQILKYIENQMDNNYLETTEINFMVTTLKALKDNHPEHKIWTQVESEALFSL